LNISQIPEYFNIGEACTSGKLREVAPSDAAIIVENENSGSSSISYSQLNISTNRFAHSLQALLAGDSVKCFVDNSARPVTPVSNNLGNPRGTDLPAELELTGHRVVLWLPNCLEFPIAFLGSLKNGSVAVPVSTMLTSDEVNYMLADSGAAVLVTTPTLWQRLQLNKPKSLRFILLVGNTANDNLAIPPDVIVLDFDDFLAAGSVQDISSPTKANDPAYLVYTSGTTGFPKGVLHAHRALLGRLPASKYWFNYQSGNDRILHSGKFNWTYVLGTALMDPLYLGKSVVVYEGTANAGTWPELIARHQCTIFIGVPTLYRQIIQKTSYNSRQVPTLRHCMCAGEHLSDEILNAWRERFQLDIFEAIGMSECSYYLSQSTEREVRAGSAGCPQPGHHIELFDEQLRPVKDGEEGMLCIGLDDPGLFICYWNLPEETAITRKGDYFLTGDYARRDKDGYIWFLGRRDDIINSFGYRISPMEIERVMKNHVAVADCVAVEESVGKDKNIVSACIILRGSEAATEAELIDYASAHLAAYKVPKAIHFVDDFPRTTNGKVIRSQLKMQLHD
jgi:acetyl-CoA synthetase